MSVVPKKPTLEPAAGFSLESKANRPDRVPLKKGEYSIASRAIALSTYFLSGALAINLSQFLGTPLYLVNQDWYNAWIAFTKQSFGLLTMTLTQTFAPTKVIVSGDASVRGQLLKSVDGNLILDFPERLVLIANHQIYTDWLYLWWIAYCNGMHGRLYIILKESLKKIPILGWGMQFNQFIFLKRNWEQDRPNMASALQKLNKVTDPMWLLLFPEGTNLAPSTRAKSAAWAKKNNMADMQHVLLPRSTGLHFCLDELKESVDYVYDCTVAYEGVPRGHYAQDIFTLKAGYLEGRPPKSVSMYWRRFAVKDIPLHNDKAFELWLTARWREKDLLMEHYLQTGRFPADKGATKYRSGKVLRGCGHMEVPIQASRWYEFLQIFAPMGILAMVLFVFYGDLPKRFWKSINKQALQSGTDDIKKAGLQAGKEAKSISTSMSNLTLDSFFDPAQQEETFKSGAMAVQKLLASSSAQKLLNRADFMQQFLSDPQKMVTDSITNKQQSFMQDLAQEEARRQLNRVSAPVGSVKPVTNGTVRQKGSFWDAVHAEEKSRHGSVVSTGQKGTFWEALDAEEKTRRGSVISHPRSKGTFWQDLKAAEDKKGGDGPTKKVAPKANFWDAVKAEENSRYGTIVTMSTDASTAVGSVSSGTTKSSQPPKLGPKKAPSSIGPAKTQTKPPLTKPASLPQKAPATNPIPAQKTTAIAKPSKAATPAPIKQGVKNASTTTSNKAASQAPRVTATQQKKPHPTNPTPQTQVPSKITPKPSTTTPKPPTTTTTLKQQQLKTSNPPPKLQNGTPSTNKTHSRPSAAKKATPKPPVPQPVKKPQPASTTTTTGQPKTKVKPSASGNANGPPKLKG